VTAPDIDDSTASKLNWLRAAVMGAGDGIVSVAGAVVVAGAAAASSNAVALTGLAVLSAGALSMASGEYSSVGTQRDGEMALFHRGRFRKSDVAKPWQAASASFTSFTAGGLVPMLAAVFSPWTWRLLIVFGAVVAALTVTGFLAALKADGPTGRGTFRVVFGGVLAMAVTYGVGRLAGATGL
jgi:VIT1/CCC1 family predicted Fe2+/Mn2+ transporter